ncbi:DUF4097 family beta strand repeat protein [candidate division KSB1 bacterium]|nr:DUF4097 family beta strand repeat protein [candidate division KSB1 bacterium]
MYKKTKAKKFCLAIMSMILICLFAPFFLTEALAHEERTEQVFDARPNGNLNIDADFGSVTIESWDRNEIKVIVIKETNQTSKSNAEELFGQYKVIYKKLDDGLEIRGEFPDEIRNRQLRVKFVVSVPKACNLDIETSGGSISVSDLKGDMELRTSGGSLKLGDIAGNVNARTSGGSITLAGADGIVNVKTSGGSISIGKTSGTINAKTSGGSITLDGSGGDVSAHTSGGSLKLMHIEGNIDASTSGGSIRVELTKQLNQDCRLETSGGTIKVYMKSDIAIDVDAATSAGKVSCELPLTVSSLLKSNKLKGQINGGGPLLKLRTSGGSIKIMEL